MALSENGKTTAKQRDPSHHCTPSTVRAVTPPNVGSYFRRTLYILPPMFWLHELPHSTRSSQQFSKRSNCPSATYSTNLNTADKDRGRDITVGIATRYELYGSGFEAGGSKRFSHLHTRPDSPFGPPSFPYNGYRGSFRRVKQSRCDVDHPPQSSAEVTDVWSYNTTSLLYLHDMM